VRGHAPISLNKIQNSLFTISSQPVAILGRGVRVKHERYGVRFFKNAWRWSNCNYSINFLLPADACSDTADARWRMLQAMWL